MTKNDKRFAALMEQWLEEARQAYDKGRIGFAAARTLCAEELQDLLTKMEHGDR